MSAIAGAIPKGHNDRELYRKEADGFYRLKSEKSKLNPRDQDRRLFYTDEIAANKMRHATVRAAKGCIYGWAAIGLPQFSLPQGYDTKNIDYCGQREGTVGGFKFGVYSEKGSVVTGHYILEDNYSIGSFSLSVAGRVHRIALFIVIDGHGDRITSRLVAELFQGEMKKGLLKHWTEGDLPSWRAAYNSFIEACYTTQSILIERAVLDGAVAAGVLIIDQKMMVPFNVGDCRVVLLDCEAKQLTEDSDARKHAHGPGVRRRKGRIIDLDDGGRVGGDLAMTRSFGDTRVRGMSARPVVYKPIDLAALEADAFVVIVCDGVTDNLSSSEIVAGVASLEGKPLVDVMKRLVTAKRGKDFYDDRTALIVKLKKSEGL